MPAQFCFFFSIWILLCNTWKMFVYVQVPAKPRKVDKKARRVQEKAPENGDHSAPSEVQESSGSSLSNSTGDRVDAPSTAPTSGLSKVTGYLPPVRERRKNIESKKSPEPDTKPKETVPTEHVAPANETTSKINDHLAEVEKFVEDSAASEAQSSEPEPQKSSIFDWVSHLSLIDEAIVRT